MKIKRIIILFAALLICVPLLAACGDDSGSGSYGDSGSDYTLADLPQWWVRPDSYEAEGISLIDIFFINYEESTWTSYDDYGNEAASGDLWVADGCLWLDAEITTVDMPIADNGTMLTYDGEPYFVAKEPSFKEALSLTGKWYHNGAVNGGSYYEFMDDGTYIYYDTDLEYERESGNYEKSSITSYFEYGDPIKTEYVSLDGGFFSTDLYPAADGKILFVHSGGFDRNSYYIHEDYAASDEIVQPALELDLLRDSWNSDNNEYYMYFSFNHSVSLSMYSGTDTSNIGADDGFSIRASLSDDYSRVYGIWTYNSDSITIEWDDGSTDIFTIMGAGDILYEDVSGITFSMSPAW